MATTLRVLEPLYTSGARDSTGAAVASGKARFYQPGTLVQQTVYQDDAAATPHTQPVTLDAGGRATVYMLDPVRMILKDSTDTTTILDTVVIQRHDQVYVTSSGINGGAETTLEAVLADATTALGSGFLYKESSGATARSYVSWLGETHVSVKDFGAVGDGVADDRAAIQSTIDRVEARGGGWVYLPKGNYLISSALTIDTAGVSICGAGRTVSRITNNSGAGNALNITLGGAADSKICLRDFSITASTTSSGAAINVTVGDRVKIENVAVALHRTGIATASVADAKITECIVESTDGNAAAIGISAGARGRVIDCEAVQATAAGQGILLSGANSLASGCRTSGFNEAIYASGIHAVVRDTAVVSAGTGVTASAQGVVVSGCHVSTCTTCILVSGTPGARVTDCYLVGATTGVTVSAACAIQGNTVASCTTGIAVGAVAGAKVVANTLTANTTDMTINGSATATIHFANTYSTFTDSALAPLDMFDATRVKQSINLTSNSGLTPSWTPTLAAGFRPLNVFLHTGAATTLTINAPAATGRQTEEILELLICNSNGGTLTVSAFWADPFGGSGSLSSVAVNTGVRVLLRYTGAEWRELGVIAMST